MRGLRWCRLGRSSRLDGPDASAVRALRNAAWPEASAQPPVVDMLQDVGRERS